MARIEFTCYKYSKLATVVSFTGSLLSWGVIMLGIGLLLSEFSLEGVVVLAVILGIGILIGAGFEFLARQIAKRKQTKILQKMLQQNGCVGFQKRK